MITQSSSGGRTMQEEKSQEQLDDTNRKIVLDYSSQIKGKKDKKVAIEVEPTPIPPPPPSSSTTTGSWTFGLF